MNHPAKRPTRHLALLCFLFLLFVGAPFLASLRYGVLAMLIIGAAVLLSGIYAVSERRQLFYVSLVLAIAAVAFNAVLLFMQSQLLALLSNICLLVVLTLFTASILADVMRAGRVTADKIYGAICVYLLIGFAWGIVYAILEQLQPDSFSAPQEIGGVSEHVARVMRMRYFSLVTLTTVGFGDIVPRSAAARMFATLEAVMGQIYLAVLVARLVGLHIVHGRKPEGDDEPK
jgi:voltage-gated potassium channel Kch